MTADSDPLPRPEDAPGAPPGGGVARDGNRDGDTDGSEGGAHDNRPVTATDLLRQALVDDEDPRFPRWLPIPGIALGVGWAAYQATTGEASLLPTLGISLAIGLGTTVAAWFGWQLEID